MTLAGIITDICVGLRTFTASVVVVAGAGLVRRTLEVVVKPVPVSVNICAVPATAVSAGVGVASVGSGFVTVSVAAVELVAGLLDFFQKSSKKTKFA
jgi:hypothetical protein